MDINEHQTKEQNVAQEDRRKFLKKAGTVAVAAPAAALLLSVSSKQAMANMRYKHIGNGEESA